MIAKDTTVAVNFLVLDLDGFPATGKASSISATISINGAQATAISDTITEKGSGWYYFNHAFGTAGNVFIEFSATNCTIMPWEDDVVELASGSAPSAADIATAVWSYQDDNNILHPYRTIYGIEYGNTIYQPYGSGHDSTLADTVWGFDPSTLVSTVTAGQRLVSIQNNIVSLPTKYDIAEEVWTTTLSNVQPTVHSTYQKMMAIPANVWTNSTRSLTTLTVTYQGTTSEIASASDIQYLQNIMATSTELALLADHGDSNWKTATGFATPTDISSAQSAIISAMPNVSGLSTFDPTNDTVNVSSTSITNIQSGLATSSNVSSAQSAIIAAMPSVSGLSTFNPSTDNVNVSSTSITSIQSGLAKTTDLSGLSTFNPTNDTVNVSSASITSIQSGLATSSNVSSAQSAIIAAMPSVSGLSTFDPANDTVKIDATQAAGMATATGFATPANVTAAVSALETYGDTNWKGSGLTAKSVWEYPDGRTITAATLSSGSLATASDITTAQSAIISAMPDVSGLSTFDATNDTVTINSEQAATMVTATGFATPSDIPTDDITSIKEKVDTLENTDLTGIATATNISDAADTVIAALPNDYATVSDLSAIESLLTQLDAGVLHWATSATRLTLYKEDNTVLRVYTLERDADGNITRISPINA